VLQVNLHNCQQVPTLISRKIYLLKNIYLKFYSEDGDLSFLRSGSGDTGFLLFCEEEEACANFLFASFRKCAARAVATENQASHSSSVTSILMASTPSERSHLRTLACGWNCQEGGQTVGCTVEPSDRKLEL
jgi:hypothetical protein